MNAFTVILTKEETNSSDSDVTRQSIASYKIMRLCAEAVRD